MANVKVQTRVNQRRQVFPNNSTGYTFMCPRWTLNNLLGVLCLFLSLYAVAPTYLKNAGKSFETLSRESWNTRDSIPQIHYWKKENKLWSHIESLLVKYTFKHQLVKWGVGKPDGILKTRTSME